METVILILSAILIVAGIVGSFLPVLPGPPLSYAGLLLMQLITPPPFTTFFIIFWLVIVIASVVLDYYVPILGTKKFGGTKYGVWGSTIGTIVGLLFFPPFGIIIGPFLGALIGELISGNKFNNALKAAWGSFLGFVAGTFLKVIICLIMAYHYISYFF